ncbi:MAG: 4Fe-4S dicluster domain-containing protein [Promethearchaeota archaeon]
MTVRPKLIKINHEFIRELIKLPECETLKKCYQCGTCASYCPSFKYSKVYNPRKIVQEVLEGLKDEIIKNANLWFCGMCHQCLENCPQGVALSEILSHIRNLASKIGNIPAHLVGEVNNLQETGQVVPPSSAINKRREKLGLPEVPDAPADEIRTLIKETGLEDMMRRKEETEKEKEREIAKEAKARMAKKEEEKKEEV